MGNVYDDPTFFDHYAQMGRSRGGLAAAGEWSQLRALFPPLAGKTVLDLGCGYGWHCAYAAQQGASRVLGLDLSEKMIAEARRRNTAPNVEYRVCGLEEYNYPAETWDAAVCNLVLHYVADLDSVYRRVFETLRPGGVFVFNIEHPVFTAGVGQDWVRDAEGRALYRPVDEDFFPGPRTTNFLGCRVEKQHHTLTQILSGVLRAGFALEAVEEAMPPEAMRGLPEMADEMRRPMMLLVRAKKP